MITCSGTTMTEPTENTLSLAEAYRVLGDCLVKNPGANLHAFRSGGGLRVVRADLGGEKLAYGEHPDIEHALGYAAEDFRLGSQEYSEVYGKTRPHYLTGSSNPSSDLDLWILQGCTFDATAEDNGFKVVLKGLGQFSTPEHVLEKVRNEGESVQWETHGFVFESYLIDEHGGVSTRSLSRPKGRDAWFYDLEKSATASSLEEAFTLALLAPEVII